MLMELCPYFNPHKYSRNVYSSLCQDFNPHKYSMDVYSSFLGKREDSFHSILIKEKNIHTIHLWGFELLSSNSPDGLTNEDFNVNNRFFKKKIES